MAGSIALSHLESNTVGLYHAVTPRGTAESASRPIAEVAADLATMPVRRAGRMHHRSFG